MDLTDNWINTQQNQNRFAKSGIFTYKILAPYEIRWIHHDIGRTSKFQ
jgi:hypothetical protein